MEKYWNCGSPNSPHEAKLGISTWNRSKGRIATGEQRYDTRSRGINAIGVKFVCVPKQTRKRLAYIHFKRNLIPNRNSQRGQCLTKICDAVSNSINSCVHLMAEGVDSEQKIWQLRSRPAHPLEPFAKFSPGRSTSPSGPDES